MEWRCIFETILDDFVGRDEESRVEGVECSLVDLNRRICQSREKKRSKTGKRDDPHRSDGIVRTDQSERHKSGVDQTVIR